jgi:hypothetical protein
MKRTITNSKRQINLARIVSIVFNPLLITTLFFLVSLNLPSHFSMIIPEKARWMIIGLIFITTFVVPALLISIFSFGMKKLVKTDEREERYLPLAIAIIFYFLTYYLLNQVQLSVVFNIFNLGATSLLVFCLLITLAWKISIYMAAAGAVFGAFLGISFTIGLDTVLILLIVILLSGIIGFSRLRYAKHSPAQIYTGFLLGAVTMFLHYLYF